MKSRRIETLVVTASLALPTSCTKKSDEEKAGTVAQDESKDGKDGGAKALEGGSAAPGSSAPPQAAVLPHEPKVVLGHVLVPSAPRLLERLEEQAATPKTKSFFDANALRSLAALSLGERADLAMHFDMEAPLGCAVVDFKAYPVPVSCTFGYKGGVEALLTDLGEVGKKDPEGHAGHFEIEGQDIYVDPLGTQVVVSTHPDLFAKTSAYIDQNLIARAPSVRGEVEILAYPSDAFALYESQIKELMAQAMKESQPLGASGNPQWDAAASHWQAYNQKSTAQSIERFAEYDQLSAHLAFRPEGFSFGLSLLPRPGSRADSEARALQGRVVDPALLAKAPSGSFVLGGFATNLDLLDSEANQELVELVANVGAELTKNDPALVKSAFAAFYDSYQATYDGHGFMALVHEAPSPLAVVSVMRKQEGKSARDEFKAWSANFKPASVLGPFAELVTWRFELDHADLSGTPVDRFVIEPTEAGKRAMLEALSEKERGDLEALWGPLRLTIDRVETPDLVLFVVAPKAEDAMTKRALAAASGQGSMAGDPGLAALTARGTKASAAIAVDVETGIAWIRGMPQLSPGVTQLPEGIGKDLSDLQMIGDYGSQPGQIWFEYVVAQALLDQIRARIDAG